MDNITNIKKLLEKFYDGQTSLEEEISLKKFFSGDGVPEELLQERELFASMSAAEVQIEVPENLNNKLIDTIRRAEQREVRVRRINLYSLSGLAAGLALIIGVYFTFLRENPSDVLAKYTIQDEEMAYIEAKRALSFVSSKLNKGTSELQSLNQVNRSIQSLTPLRKVSSGNKELQLLGNLEKAGNIQLQ